MLVKNWSQVIKSLSVWLPVVSSTGWVFLQGSAEAGLIPAIILPIIVGISGAFGWVIPQKSMRK